MGAETVDTDAKPVHARIIRTGHQHHRAHRHIRRHVYAKAAPGLVDNTAAHDQPPAIADLLPRLPGENDLA